MPYARLNKVFLRPGAVTLFGCGPWPRCAMKIAVQEIRLNQYKLFRRGKVRDVYDLDDKILLVATDRISAFDVIMPNGIPDKGKILTQMSSFWFEQTSDIVENHVISCDINDFPSELQDATAIIKNRSMLAKKTNALEVECIVRGYISGSGWKDYQKAGSICGITMPDSLKESSKLIEPVFTPSTKASSGHDVNISISEVENRLGKELTKSLKEKSFLIYQKAYEKAYKVGIIIADTKFEFGLINDKLILIDEILTPDSSRFWPLDDYEEGRAQKSYDKQYVRDYLETLDWNKKPPAPELPEEIVDNTRSKYLEAFRLITGNEPDLT